jgi:hypothetical protein
MHLSILEPLFLSNRSVTYLSLFSIKVSISSLGESESPYLDNDFP